MIIKKNKIPTLLGIVILLVGTFTGVFFLNMNQVFRIGADADSMPKDVRTSNITDSTITVSWVTDKETTGFLSWGQTQGNLNKIVEEAGSGQKSFIHSVILTGLEPSTTYFYRINSDGTNFENNGIPWQATTGSNLPISQSSFPISGSVISASGKNIDKALVYITVGGYLASTLTSDTGNFIFQLGSLRSPDLKNYIQINPAQTLIEISVQAGPEGVATGQIFPQSAKPIPPMVLGRVYDFRNQAPSPEGQTPNALLKLPETSTAASKFNFSQDLGTPAPSGSVILESLTQGEVISTATPAFFGKGPKGNTVNVSITNVNPVTEAFVIPSNGSWEWSPPETLSQGTHKITLSWKDSIGITRSLSRDFTIQTGEVPSFEATPSQTLAPTPSSTPLATATPAVTPTIRPTLAPTPTASSAPVPVTGSLTPTLLLSIMSIGVFTFSIFIWKMAEK